MNLTLLSLGSRAERRRLCRLALLGSILMSAACGRTVGDLGGAVGGGEAGSAGDVGGSAGDAGGSSGSDGSGGSGLQGGYGGGGTTGDGGTSGETGRGGGGFGGWGAVGGDGGGAGSSGGSAGWSGAGGSAGWSGAGGSVGGDGGWSGSVGGEGGWGGFSGNGGWGGFGGNGGWGGAGGISGEIEWQQIFAGGSRVCVVGSKGEAGCWSYGQYLDVPAACQDEAWTSLTLSDGNFCGITTSEEGKCCAPARTYGPPDGTKVTSLGAGYDNKSVCWTQPNGALSCFWWVLPGAENDKFQQVSASDSLVCALNHQAQITCWQPTATAESSFLWATGKFVNTLVTSYSVCALDATGVVRCLGPVPSGPMMREAELVAEPSQKIVASPNWETICSLATNSTVTCHSFQYWNEPPFALLGQMPHKDYQALAAGDGFVCGLRPNHRVYCQYFDGAPYPVPPDIMSD